MKSNFIIISVLIAGIIGANAFAASMTSTDKLKSCMAAIFMSQSDFHQKNKTYTQNWSDLALDQNSDCQGLKKEVESANKENFAMKVSDGTQVWKIDSSKSMTKIK